MGLVGRNNPCPCGSRRKFKKCCFGKDASAAQSFTPADRERALAELTAFAHRAAFTEAHDAAEAIFWGDALDGVADEEADKLEDITQGDYAFHMWLVFDFPVEPDGPAPAGRTLADLWLEQTGGRVGAGEREYVARMRSTQLRLCEVTEVVPEEGLWLADLWTDQRLWIRERRATRQLVRWDLMAVRLMPGADGELVIDGPPYPFPASDKEEILDGLGPRFVLYYNVSEDTYGMSEPAHATVFKRRAAAVAVRKMLGGGVPIVQCDVDGHGQLVLNSLPARWRRRRGRLPADAHRAVERRLVSPGRQVRYCRVKVTRSSVNPRRPKLGRRRGRVSGASASLGHRASSPSRAALVS